MHLEQIWSDPEIKNFLGHIYGQIHATSQFKMSIFPK